MSIHQTKESEYSEEWVSVDSLFPADSPRLAGENIEHARTLASSDAVLPSIIVQRGTGRVIDGMHRLRAAKLRGQRRILVRFYDGDDDDSFIAAVETNIAHGLPLTQADRVAAAARIVAIRPRWSDRRIASVTGLSAATVGAVRRRSTAGTVQSNVSDRVGRDGKARPLDVAAGRLRAGELIAERPDAPVREIAEAAGVSPATAWDVRNRLRDGRDPVPDRQRTARDVVTAASDAGKVDCDALLRGLKRDPSLRFTDSGRALLRWLDAQAPDLAQWKQLVDDIPAHCVQIIATLARHHSDSWQEFAQYVGSRGDDQSSVAAEPGDLRR